MNPHINFHDVRRRCFAQFSGRSGAFVCSRGLRFRPDGHRALRAAVYPLNNDNSVRPARQITYTITSGNGAAAVNNAYNVQVGDTIDPNSTFDNDSRQGLANAIAHGYNAVGNTQLAVNAATWPPKWRRRYRWRYSGGQSGGHLGNFATSAGGSVLINADGSFVYTPQTGDQLLNDTFSYTVTDGDGLPSTGLVTINLGARVWYVDSTYAGGLRTARTQNRSTRSQTSPARPGRTPANDIIFIIESARQITMAT